ncbi:ubiquitin carboxyl-terminal hydrolase 19 [Beta vulgaris subsp. vulgaris]|uniref:ubiquitin carboxyl-terminal hydrolase 19 n=1 Tax=Beta vulgaris subsp. vulgaris TaxID=3555 RepID=UPI002036DD1B|nr:ubiquitin carboxyl-terminal hydrolase 19 [Beta vulgaris subsp. vulgaris]
MEEQTQKTKISIPITKETPPSENMQLKNPLLDFAQVDQILGECSSTKETENLVVETTESDNPVVQIMETENPCLDFTQSEQKTLGGFSEIEDAECSKTLEESVKEDSLFSKTLEESLKEGDEKLELKDAQIKKTLDESVNERGENWEDVDFTKTLDDLSADTEIFEKLIDFGDNDEGGNLLDKVEETRLSPMVGPLVEYHFPEKCDCGDEEEDEEGCYRRNRFPDWRSPRRFNHDEPHSCRAGGYYGGRYMRMMGRDHHHRRHCRRRPLYPGRERENELFRYPSMGCYEPEPCPVGAGLANLGNTCFLNAILQCFTHTVPFVEGLLSLKHEASSHGDEFCVICAVREQIEHSLAYSGRVISPSNLVDNLSNISSFFQRYQQEDAHEFLQCLSDKLDRSWSKYEASANDASGPNNLPLPDDPLVNQIFGGRLVSQVRCCKCGHNSDTYEPLIDLSLEIEEVDSLENALKSFTKVESIEDTEKFTCDSCKEQVQVEKQLMLYQAPSVAAFHLKRFKSDGVDVEKIDKTVEYPLDLDLAPYTKGSNDENENLKYELFAIVVHVGHWSTSGHYFCYIRTSPDKWYRFDDSKVTRVYEEIALCQDAYILFYARKGTPWFGSLIEKWKAECSKKVLSTSPKSVLDDMDLPSTSYPLGTGFHGCKASDSRDAFGDTFNEPASEVKRDENKIMAGAETGDLHCSEAGRNRDTSVAPLSDLRQDVVEKKAGVDAQNSAVAKQSSAPSSSVPIIEEVKEVKAEIDILLLLEEDCDSSKNRTCSNKIGEIEQMSSGTGIWNPPSHFENIFDGEPKFDVGIEPSTPLGAQSPDIYSDEEQPADAAYSVPHEHLKIVDKSSSAKKSSNTSKHDVKRKEAAKYIRKSMTSARGQMLLAAVYGSRSDNSLMKKKRKQPSFVHGKNSPKKRVKISPKRVLRPLTA